MPIDILILFLRILSAILLYLFLGLIFRGLIREVSILARRDQDDANLTPFGLLLLECSPDGNHSPGTMFSLTRQTSIGRARTNAIILNDQFASTLHATISYEDGVCWLVDHESRNGTHLNDVPLSNRVALTNGDLIKIGQVVFEFVNQTAADQ